MVTHKKHKLRLQQHLRKPLKPKQHIQFCNLWWWMLNMMLDFKCRRYIIVCGVLRSWGGQNTARGSLYIGDTTTVGTTLKGHYRIVQYRDGDYIHTTLTPWTGKDRIETGKLPDLQLGDRTARRQLWRFMSAQFLLKRSVVPRPPADEHKKDKCSLLSYSRFVQLSQVL